TWWCRTTPSFPTPRSRSADTDERTRIHLRTEDGFRALARHAPPHHPLQRGPDVVPDPEEPELLVDLRRHPGHVPGHPDRLGHRAGHALRAARRPRLRLGRTHHARR